MAESREGVDLRGRALSEVAASVRVVIFERCRRGGAAVGEPGWLQERRRRRLGAAAALTARGRASGAPPVGRGRGQRSVVSLYDPIYKL